MENIVENAGAAGDEKLRLKRKRCHQNRKDKRTREDSFFVNCLHPSQFTSFEPGLESEYLRLLELWEELGIKIFQNSPGGYDQCDPDDGFEEWWDQFDARGNLRPPPYPLTEEDQREADTKSVIHAQLVIERAALKPQIRAHGVRIGILW